MLTIETLARHREKHFFMSVSMEKFPIKNIFAKYLKKFLENLSLRKFFLGDFTTGTPIVTAWWYGGFVVGDLGDQICSDFGRMCTCSSELLKCFAKIFFIENFSMITDMKKCFSLHLVNVSSVSIFENLIF